MENVFQFLSNQNIYNLFIFFQSPILSNSSTTTFHRQKHKNLEFLHSFLVQPKRQSFINVLRLLSSNWNWNLQRSKEIGRVDTLRIGYTTKRRTGTDAARITTAFVLVAINDAEHRFCAPRIGRRTSSWLPSFLFPCPGHLHPSSFLFFIPPFPAKMPRYFYSSRKKAEISLFLAFFLLSFLFLFLLLRSERIYLLDERDETRIYTSWLEFGDEWTSLRKSDRELYFFFFFPYWKDRCCFVLPLVCVCVCLFVERDIEFIMRYKIVIINYNLNL